MAETMLGERNAIQFLYMEPAPGSTSSLSTYAILLSFCQKLNRRMRMECPVNKNPHAKNRGALRESLEVRPLAVGEGDTAIGFYALDYVEWVLSGTHPHVIEPRSGSVPAPGGKTQRRRALVFQWQTHMKIPKIRGRQSRGYSWSRPQFLGEEGSGHAFGVFSQLEAAVRLSQGKHTYGSVRTGTRAYVTSRSREQFSKRGREYQTPAERTGARPQLRRSVGVVRPRSPANVEESYLYDGEAAVALARVNHPGAKPNNFLARAMAYSRTDIAEVEDALFQKMEEITTRTIESEIRLFGQDF
jgi:hypothetical protein